MPDGDHCWGPEPGAEAAVRAAWDALARVNDPEIPVLTVVDLGMVRRVGRDADGRLRVTITPTYSGCPATGVITVEIRRALDEAGLGDAILDSAVFPPWTTDWISEAGLEKLRACGIAPPPRGAGKRALTAPDELPACPRCGSADTKVISAFGSTACKALHRCNACLEPFDSFKCI